MTTDSNRLAEITDSERMDWLEMVGHRMSWPVGDQSYVGWCFPVNSTEELIGGLRYAIDAAMAAEEGGGG